MADVPAKKKSRKRKPSAELKQQESVFADANHSDPSCKVEQLVQGISGSHRLP
jgi:hypothetical protein